MSRAPFPNPTADMPAHQRLVSGKDGEPDPNDPDDTIDLWGHCWPWCGIPETERRDGIPVSDHGTYCERAVGASADGLDMDGNEVAIYPYLAGTYHHGVYHRSAISGRRNETYVALKVLAPGLIPDDPDDLDGGKSLLLTSPVARSLAATLLYAADKIDRLLE